MGGGERSMRGDDHSMGSGERSMKGDDHSMGGAEDSPFGDAPLSLAQSPQTRWPTSTSYQGPQQPAKRGLRVRVRSGLGLGLGLGLGSSQEIADTHSCWAYY